MPWLEYLPRNPLTVAIIFYHSSKASNLAFILIAQIMPFAIYRKKLLSVYPEVPSLSPLRLYTTEWRRTTNISVFAWCWNILLSPLRLFKGQILSAALTQAGKLWGHQDVHMWETWKAIGKHNHSAVNILQAGGIFFPPLLPVATAAVYTLILLRQRKHFHFSWFVWGFREAQFGNDFETERRDAATGFFSVYNADASFFSAMRVINDMSFWPFTFVDFP